MMMREPVAVSSTGISLRRSPLGSRAKQRVFDAAEGSSISAGMPSVRTGALPQSAVDFERRIITIRAGQAKTASRRIVPMSDNLAEVKNVQQVALEAGNSPAIIFRHYRRKVKTQGKTRLKCLLNYWTDFRGPHSLYREGKSGDVAVFAQRQDVARRRLVSGLRLASGGSCYCSS